MAEFKMYDALRTDISGISSASAELNASLTEVTTDGVSSLKTSVKFVEEHKAIKELIALYKQLLEKEVRDLNSIKNNADALDAQAMGT